MSDLGPVPELDYDAFDVVYRLHPDALMVKAIQAAAADLDAYAHAARERIEQLEGEVALLGDLVDEASVALITGNCPNIPLCERIAAAREERLSAIEQERQQP